MSNIEDRAKEILKEEIAELIRLQDQFITGKRMVIENMARKLEDAGMEPEKISGIIKKILKDNGIEISDGTIQRAVKANQKRKYDRYQSPAKSVENTDFQQPVTVASDGSTIPDDIASESYTKPDGTEGEQEADPDKMSNLFTGEISNEEIPFELYEGEPDDVIVPEALEVARTAADIAMTANKDLEIRLNEALKLADDKDIRIYQLEMQSGELEVQIADLKKKLEDKKPSAVNQKQVDTIEELTIERDNLKLALHEMKEIERIRLKESGFTTASKIPKHPWIQASDALAFYIALHKAANFLNANNDSYRKILFTVEDDGRLGLAYLEGNDHDAYQQK